MELSKNAIYNIPLQWNKIIRDEKFSRNTHTLEGAKSNEIEIYNHSALKACHTRTHNHEHKHGELHYSEKEWKSPSAMLTKRQRNPTKKSAWKTKLGNKLKVKMPIDLRSMWTMSVEFLYWVRTLHMRCSPTVVELKVDSKFRQWVRSSDEHMQWINK